MSQEITFEEALKQLEDTVDKLERGELSLEDSLTEFEKGVRLTKFCSNKLDQAEERIEVIKEENGEIGVESYNYRGEGE
ncbi:exodeoxyribonuclease VII small subunit [Orenia marismortui]|uniref:Exodeoxyribonuclease 7 small subunit n=1 Tax=Orenia marismortui TaxID=46469 RepID=A0A4V3GXK1_9FIRM|nr:exodeoxyribonuclease VII small subunit [Orenia marismortui]TDX48260.1 exodeoxyribonuclease VII small subunit [Orenia marismortui]